MFRFARCSRGFTFLELVLAVVIIVILIAVSLPRFIELSESAREAATRSGLGTIRSVVAILYAKNIAEDKKEYPQSLKPSDFAEGGVPANRLNSKVEVKYVTEDVSETFPQSSAYGWWYNTKNGRVGAYSDGKTDTSNW